MHFSSIPRATGSPMIGLQLSMKKHAIISSYWFLGFIQSLSGGGFAEGCALWN